MRRRFVVMLEKTGAAQVEESAPALRNEEYFIHYKVLFSSGGVIKPVKVQHCQSLVGLAEMKRCEATRCNPKLNQASLVLGTSHIVDGLRGTCRKSRKKTYTKMIRSSFMCILCTRKTKCHHGGINFFFKKKLFRCVLKDFHDSSKKIVSDIPSFQLSNTNATSHSLN